MTTLSRLQQKLLDGRYRWGLVSRRTGRYGAESIRLVIYPPNTSIVERRCARLARFWPGVSIGLKAPALATLTGVPMFAIIASMILLAVTIGIALTRISTPLSCSVLQVQRQVARGVDQHQEADAGSQERVQGRETVELYCEAQVQARRPRDVHCTAPGEPGHERRPGRQPGETCPDRGRERRAQATGERGEKRQRERYQYGQSRQEQPPDTRGLRNSLGDSNTCLSPSKRSGGRALVVWPGPVFAGYIVLISGRSSGHPGSAPIRSRVRRYNETWKKETLGAQWFN